MSVHFLGADFSIQKARQLGPASFRVRFTHDPLAASASGTNDALNVANYTLSGPSLAVITFAAVVPDDPQSIDLTVSAPLGLGTWTITGSTNLQTADGRPLQAPRSTTFPVTYLAPSEDVAAGASNDTAESTIRKHLPAGFAGKAWDALIAALAVGDKMNWDNAKLAFDQLFKSTASGLYLDRKAADDGLQRPPSIGMPDDLFRKLAIKTSAAKLTHETILEILEVFYGSDSVRASVTTNLAEPFNLADGNGLDLLLEEKDAVSIFFHDGDFARINQATALEVAMAITRGLRQNKNSGFAVVVKDPLTNLNKVRVYSGALGLSSSVRVTGGRAQLGLQFPDLLTTYSSTVTSADTYNWVVSVPASGTNRVTLTNAGGTSKVDLSGVRVGDYVVFEAANSTIPASVYAIKDVSVSFSGAALVQSFDISADASAHSFLQLANSELTFFRPDRQTIHQAGARTVVVAQTKPGSLEISLPATTQAVGRTSLIAAYPHERDPFTVTALHRDLDTVKVSTSASHGLVVGDHVFVDDVYAGFSAPSVTLGNPGTTGSPGTTNASLATIWTQIRAQDAQTTKSGSAITLTDGRVVLIGGFHTVGGVDIADSSCQIFKVNSSSVQADGSIQYNYSWNSATSMTGARNRHGASLLTDAAHAGSVLVSGGFNGSTYLDTAAIYTPNSTTGSWGSTGSLAQKRALHGQVTLGNGKVLVTGGANTEVMALSTTELFDPAAGTWSSGPSMLDVRCDHRALVLNDGSVLVVGGRPLAQPAVDDSNTLAHWKIDEAGGTSAADSIGAYNLTATNSPTIVVGKIVNARDFSVANSYLSGAGNSAATTSLNGAWTVSAWFKGGTGVIFSYGTAGTAQVQVEISSPNKIKWTWGGSNGTTGTITNWSSFWNHVAVAARDDGNGTYTVEVYLNGVLAQSFATISSPGSASVGTFYIGRSSTAGTTFGGQIDDVYLAKYAHSAARIALIYRRGQGAVGTNAGLLPAADGQLHSSCEIYNGTSFVRTGSMDYARIGHRATLLPDGRVLVTGGYGYRDGTGEAEHLIQNAEIWDPTTGRWSPAGKMMVARAWHGAVYQPERGLVLIAGGAQAPEYWDPKTSSFRYCPNAPTNANAALSTKLALATDPTTGNHLALLVGGDAGDGSIQASYLYAPGEDVFAAGGMNGLVRVTSAPTPTTFWYQTPTRSGLSNLATASIPTIRPVAAAAAGDIPGPYILDPLEGVAVTGTEAEATMDLNEGRQYGILEVTDASIFPDEEGWLVIGFGGDASVYPVRYLGRLSNTALILDYNFKFTASNTVTGFTLASATRASNQTTLTLNLPVGTTDHGIAVGDKIYFKAQDPNFSHGWYTVTARTSTTVVFSDIGTNASSSSPGTLVIKGPRVTLLKQKGLFSPENPEQIGALYITASNAGRTAAVAATEDAVAAGLNLTIEVQYPSDRGLGNEGQPTSGDTKINDQVSVWGGDNLTDELATARGES